jgi:hypothetical protein
MKVEKAHFDRLFDLVGERAGEEDDGDMSLPHFYLARRVPESSRIRKRLNEAFNLHDNSP